MTAIQKGLMVMVLGVLTVQGLWAAPDWEDETVIGINKEPARASGLSFGSVRSALAGLQWTPPQELKAKR